MICVNDPCAELKDNLSRIEADLEEKRKNLTEERQILLGYRELIDERVAYTNNDRNWIRDLLADCRTELDAYNNSASPYDVIDNNRPLISAANSRGLAVGKLRDEIRALNGKRRSAQRALEDCLNQNQQTKRCLKPRYGRGFEGVPCQITLGKAGICRFHG